MKTLYIGSRIEALIILELFLKSNDLEAPMIYTPINSRIQIDRKNNNLIYYDRKNKNETLKKLSDILIQNSFDLVISVGFNFLIPKEILDDNINTVFINSHPHLLPKWKGNNAIKESVLEGETEYGCTVHYIDEKMDNGPIISQLETSKISDII